MTAVQHDVLVVGGGPAGLACAIALLRRGREPLVLEAADAPGGRVRTDERSGFLLDRGFQVVNTTYPALARYAPVAELALHLLPSSATVVWEGRQHVVGNPLRDPASVVGMLRAPFLGLGDALALARAVGPHLVTNRAAIGSDADDLSAAQWLADSGVPARVVEAFLRPFFGGVLLDPELGTSARCLRYDLRQFSVGAAGLPARGMRAVPEFMASRLGTHRVRTESRVAALLRGHDGTVGGVRLHDGAELRAAAVVIATEAPAAAELTGLPLPTEGVGEVAVHVALDRRLLPGGRLLLDPTPGAVFTNCAEPAAVAPAYAPAGRSAVVLVAPGALGAGAVERRDPRAGWDDATWHSAADEALRTWFPSLPAAATHMLRVDRIPFGLLRQPPGIHARLRALADTGIPGLHLAGEHTLAASLNAAMLSGERAARAVVADPPR